MQWFIGVTACESQHFHQCVKYQKSNSYFGENGGIYLLYKKIKLKKIHILATAAPSPLSLSPAVISATMSAYLIVEIGVCFNKKYLKGMMHHENRV